MSSYQPSVADFKFEQTFAPFTQGKDLPLGDILTTEDIERIAEEEKVTFGRRPGTFWTPAVTVWAFLWQVLSAEGSCRAAVCKAFMMFALIREPQDVDTAGYCRARSHVPAAFFKRLTMLVGKRMEQAIPGDWLWFGHHIYLIDGSTSTLQDNDDNQKAFPQPKTQKPGLGYPMIRWVIILALATATVQNFAYGPYAGKETSELALLRTMLDGFMPGDVVVADRFYCSYFMIVLLQARGVHVVFRLHQRRKFDFRRGQRLGQGDHVVVWTKPARPDWMDEELYATMPETLTIREIQITIDVPGFKVRHLVVATTLLDAETYTAESIGSLYYKRWHAELDIRTLKRTLQLGELRCQTPFMVEKEIWANCLAYNLVRKTAAQAAVLAGRHPRSISFTATKHVVLGAWEKMSEMTGEDYVRLAQAQLRVLKKEKVGHRPDRCEPHAVKMRPKKTFLTEPREKARERLKNGRWTKPKAKPRKKAG